MNLIMSLQRCLVLHAACKWASLRGALRKAAAGGIAARSWEEPPAPPYQGGVRHALQVGLTNGAHRSPDQLA